MIAAIFRRCLNRIWPSVPTACPPAKTGVHGDHSLLGVWFYIVLVLLMASGPAFAQTENAGDYDEDNDGYIDVANLAQLNAIRYDVNGDGVVASADTMNYNAAFPNRFTTASARMGCPSGRCVGYELTASLDFDSDDDGDVDANDHNGNYWDSGSGWLPIGFPNRSYTGDFKGNGHTINNLFISRTDHTHIALFYRFGTGSRIETLGVTNANITGGQYVGVLVGRNDGTIVACYTTGRVAGANAPFGQNIGGLAARSEIGATISTSYSTVSVSGTEGVGGLVSRVDNSSIINSYATGPVRGTSNVGGFIATLSGTSGSIYNSYWNTETSGQSRGIGAIFNHDHDPTVSGITGQTTADLLSITGYTGIYGSWNIDLNGQPGNDDPWNFGTVNQYPVLKYAGMDTTVQFDLQPEIVMLTLTPSTISENGGVSTVTARLIRSLSAATTITVRPVVEAYTVGMDSTIVIASGQTANASDTVVITAVDNNTASGDKRVTVFSAVDNSVGRRTVIPATLTIADDDVAQVMLVLSPSSISEDGGVSTITATLDRPTTKATTITVSATAVSPAVAGDFTLSAATTLTIAASVTTSTGLVTITAVNNMIQAPDKRVTVSGTVAGGNGALAPSAVTLTITENAVDYDEDNDGYIDVANLAQLNAIRYDINGDGVVASADTMNYNAAFPNRFTTASARMGCPSGRCVGYELTASLDFDSDGDGDVDANDHNGNYWDSGSGWLPIGYPNRSYTGDFKGNGHTINNLFISRTGTHIGLFYRFGTGSRIETLGITNANITGGQHVGVLVGRNDGTIVACYTTGRVAGTAAFGQGIGGLAARSESGGTISTSYSTVSVSGTEGVGGLVSRVHNTSIINSYATGPVRGTSNVGGFIGSLSGSTSSISNSYWDTETSGQSRAIGVIINPSLTADVTGQTTADLISITGYTGIYGSWNIDLNGQPGNDEPWTFGTVNQYPVLKYAGMDTTVQFNLQPEIVRLTLTPSTISENGGVSTVTAKLTQSLSAATTITVRPVAGAYTVGMDSTIVIASGQTANASDTAVITAVDNSTTSGDKRVIVLSAVDNSASTRTVALATMTIVDDDVAQVTLVLSPASISEDGGVSTITATLDRPLIKATTITVSAEAESPAVAGDFTLSTAKTLTVAANATASTGLVTITSANNTTDAPDKRVTVSATVAVGNLAAVLSAVALMITDDDDPPTVALSLSPASISEASGVSTITATLSHESSEATTITVRPVAGAYTVGTDSTITIAAGQTANTSGYGAHHSGGQHGPCAGQQCDRVRCATQRPRRGQCDRHGVDDHRG